MCQWADFLLFPVFFFFWLQRDVRLSRNSFSFGDYIFSNFFQGVVVLGWALAAACNLAVLYGLYEYNSGKAVESIHVIALYQACSRTAWGLGLAWVIFACCRGYGGKWCIEAFQTKQEGNSVECQLPTCRQSTPHTEQVLIRLGGGGGVPVQWDPSWICRV